MSQVNIFNLMHPSLRAIRSEVIESLLLSNQVVVYRTLKSTVQIHMTSSSKRIKWSLSVHSENYIRYIFMAFSLVYFVKVVYRFLCRLDIVESISNLSSNTSESLYCIHDMIKSDFERQNIYHEHIFY